MSATMHEYLLGKHTTQILITPQTVTLGSTGTTLADDGGYTGAVAFEGLVQMLPITLNPNKKNIKATNSTRDNYLILGDGYQISLTSLRPITTSASNLAPILALIKAYNYFKVTYVVTVTDGSTTKTLTIVAYGSRGAYNAGHEGEGEQTESITLDCIDVGATDFFKVTPA